MEFEYTTLTPDEARLQQEVRGFLNDALPLGSFEPGLGMQGGWDPAFSRLLGEQHWLGMALPERYGGAGRSFVERFVVMEELLQIGAPVSFHWVADRQSGPVINRFGNDEQKERMLAPICRGEVSFAIGMSEAASGSDLASLKTNAKRVDGGWLINGTKIWTTNGHRCDWLIVLARTSVEEKRQAGLTQFLLPRTAEGVRAEPIVLLDGKEDFAEVQFTDVFVPDADVLGQVGAGWSQNTAELAFERGGPDRWLSTFSLFRAWQAVARRDERSARFAAETVATLRVVRDLSLSIARSLDRGDSPVVHAALVKEYGTRFEQQIAIDIERLYGRPVEPDSRDPFERHLARALLNAPSFTIRGGTSEVLRTVVVKQMLAGTR